MEHFEPSNYFIRDWFAPLSAIGELLLTLTNIIYIYIYSPHSIHSYTIYLLRNFGNLSTDKKTFVYYVLLHFIYNS